MKVEDMSNPITSQPGSADYDRGGGYNGGRNALDVLRNMDFVRVKQNLEWCEICCCNCCETENSYTICNNQGTKLFRAKEESCCCCRYGCGAARPFDMYVKDQDDNDVMRIERPLRCQTNCCPCCQQTVRVYAPVDDQVGSVSQDCGCTRPTFTVHDKDGEPALKISGPCACCNFGVMCGDRCCGMCSVCCCRTVGFTITNIDSDDEVGLIRKEFSGVGKELVTDADNFYVTFPRELAFELKLSLLSAVFLIDYMYFEKSPPKSGDGQGSAHSQN